MSRDKKRTTVASVDAKQNQVEPKRGGNVSIFRGASIRTHYSRRPCFLLVSEPYTGPGLGVVGEIAC